MLFDRYLEAGLGFSMPARENGVLRQIPGVSVMGAQQQILVIHSQHRSSQAADGVMIGF